MKLLPDSFFTESRYSVSPDSPTFYSRRLVDTKLLKIEVHKFVGTDAPDTYHTHPAYAIRIGLRGGYIEQLLGGEISPFRAGDIGFVTPSTCHLVKELCYGRPAYTLWIRGPKVAPIMIRGRGAASHGFFQGGL